MNMHFVLQVAAYILTLRAVDLTACIVIYIVGRCEHCLHNTQVVQTYLHASLYLCMFELGMRHRMLAQMCIVIHGGAPFKVVRLSSVHLCRGCETFRLELLSKCQSIPVGLLGLRAASAVGHGNVDLLDRKGQERSYRYKQSNSLRTTTAQRARRRTRSSTLAARQKHDHRRRCPNRKADYRHC